MTLNHKRILFGLFYIPPSANAVYFSSIEDSIHLAIDTGIQDIIVNGDFNFNLSNEQLSVKVKDLCEQFSFEQEIEEPTHYTKHFSSLLDKGGNRSSLLCNPEKLFERVVFNHPYNHLNENQILTPLQSGFIPGNSTINQLTYLYNFFAQALDSGKEVCVVFCDISKAFDRVWHEGLLLKFEAAGISGNLLL